MNGQFPTLSTSIAMIISEAIYQAVVGIDRAVQFSINLLTSQK